MKLIYLNEKVEMQCTNVKAASRLFGGDKKLAVKLLSRVNAMKSASVIKDIIVQPQFRFHSLLNRDHKDLSGYFAIDVKTKRDPWRIILEPLDSSESPYVPCRIDEIADEVKTIRIREVSKHYE